jgi:uncharacterized coiled-coil protein SlyX
MKSALQYAKKRSFVARCLFPLIVMGCLSAPEIYPPEKAPAYVRQIKYFRLFGTSPKSDTGIVLNKGDWVTIMSTGRILRSRGSIGDLPSSWHYLFFIGDQSYGNIITPMHGGTFEAPASGPFSLGILDSNHLDNQGHFDVTIILWNTNDPSQVTEFLEIMKRQTPENRSFIEAYEQAETRKRIAAAKEKASKDIGSISNELKKLKSDAPQGTSTNRIRDLETRLAALNNKLAQLDELSRQLATQRAESAQLISRLEEIDQREREFAGKAGEKTKAPPMLLITSPDGSAEVETDRVWLSGAAQDDTGIQQLEVFINEQPVKFSASQSTRGNVNETQRRLNFSEELLLKPGENFIRIRATDLDGLQTERALTLNFTPSRRNIWAVVVGINDYPRLPKLKYAVNDAYALQRLLSEHNRVPAENITLLINEQATLRNLRSALGTGLKSSAGSEDMVIIFFAGHGATERDATNSDGDGLEKYLLTYDSDPADLFSTGMPMRDIALIFNRIQSERLIFIADACYSGASGGRTVGTGGLRANISDSFLERLAGGRGKVIITASAANEVSMEKNELQHGVFTYYLIEGLRGAADIDRDGMVTVDEAYRYVSDKVPRATGQEQHPVKKGSVEGSLVLSITR